MVVYLFFNGSAYQGFSFYTKFVFLTSFVGEGLFLGVYFKGLFHLSICSICVFT
jgi:hypothetical protein